MGNIYEGLNVYQKLAKARLYFLNSKATKSGKNMHLEFKYFELDDIVPTAIRIFARVGLVTNIEFTADSAVMNVMNCDEPCESPISFTVPYREIKPIVSKSGASVTNEMQALGSSITYLRRYLWMCALDITEPDSIDASSGEEENQTEFAEEKKAVKVKDTKKKKTPTTTEERKEAKKELTEDTQATDEEITALKTLCKELMNKDEEQEDFVQQIAMKTEGFTKLASSSCKALIENIQSILEEYDK